MLVAAAWYAANRQRHVDRVRESAKLRRARKREARRLAALEARLAPILAHAAAWELRPGEAELFHIFATESKWRGEELLVRLPRWPKAK